MRFFINLFGLEQFCCKLFHCLLAWSMPTNGWRKFLIIF